MFKFLNIFVRKLTASGTVQSPCGAFRSNTFSTHEMSFLKDQHKINDSYEVLHAWQLILDWLDRSSEKWLRNSVTKSTDIFVSLKTENCFNDEPLLSRIRCCYDSFFVVLCCFVLFSVFLLSLSISPELLALISIINNYAHRRTYDRLKLNVSAVVRLINIWKLSGACSGVLRAHCLPATSYGNNLISEDMKATLDGTVPVLLRFCEAEEN